jgi:hypothetical protein
LDFRIKSLNLLLISGEMRSGTERRWWLFVVQVGLARWLLVGGGILLAGFNKSRSCFTLSRIGSSSCRSPPKGGRRPDIAVSHNH